MGTVLSVVVPLYNSGQTIGRALDSLLHQPAFAELEVIIVDDGSTDGGGEIAEQYSRRHDNIMVLHRSNAGLSSAYNLGIEKASS